MIMKFHGSLLMTSLDLLERREGRLIGTKYILHSDYYKLGDD